MTRPSLPPDVFDALPSAAPADLRSLEVRLCDLEARLGQNATHTSKPPSSDPPHLKPAPPKTPSGTRTGGHPGHPKRSRPDRPPDVVVGLPAGTCDGGSHPLAGDDPAPLRHHVIKVPPVRPHATEYRRHRLRCSTCGRVTRPARPANARGGYGPRARAACAPPSGAYRVGGRGVARRCGGLRGVPVSPAAVCDPRRETATAREPVAREARPHGAGTPADVDETGRREGRRRGGCGSR